MKLPPAWENLPKNEFAFPGELRDRLNSLILSGVKVATTSLVADFEACGESIPQAGMRTVLVDSDGAPIALLETTEVRVVRVGDVGLQHVVDEGEGHPDVAAWRVSHEAFWHSEMMRESLGDMDFRVTDDTMAVLERFACLEALEPRG